MATINEILDFNFYPANLKQAAVNLFPVHLTRQFEKRIGKLDKITQEVGESDFNFKETNLIPIVFNKFKNAYHNRIFNTPFDKRELKVLAYSLAHSENRQQTILNDKDELFFVFTLIETKWRDSYIVGLIDCYFKNWGNKNYQPSLEVLGNFILEKLTKYEGNRTVLKSLKANTKFLNSIHGDVLLGSELALRNVGIKNATKFLSVPGNWFSYSYFSKTILAYYDKRKTDVADFIDDLISSLNEHNNSITNKRVVSQLIIQSNIPQYANLQDKIKAIAFELIGDPGIATKWMAFDNATDNEKQDIKDARNILNEWLTKEFLNVFFEKCIKDPRRKKFWLKYAKEISRFRVVGSIYVKEKLLRIDSISKYVDPRFCKTKSGDTNSALMFIMKNYLFIEFSDAGAFYAYKLSNPHAPSIDSAIFSSTNDLKITSMDQIAYRQGSHIYRTNEEGKLGHGDGDLNWETVASYWIKNKLGINA